MRFYRKAVGLLHWILYLKSKVYISHWAVAKSRQFPLDNLKTLRVGVKGLAELVRGGDQVCWTENMADMGFSKSFLSREVMH
jgi:hypothetical protein